MNEFRIAATSFAATVAAIMLTAPARADQPTAWSTWSDRAQSIALADAYGNTDDDAEPAAFNAACAEARRPIAGLPKWTTALVPYCRAVYLMKTWSEFPVPMWRKVCRDGLAAVALLEQAGPIAAEPRVEPAARRLVTQWRENYAASCPAVIPPPGYPR